MSLSLKQTRDNRIEQAIKIAEELSKVTSVLVEKPQQAELLVIHGKVRDVILRLRDFQGVQVNWSIKYSKDTFDSVKAIALAEKLDKLLYRIILGDIKVDRSPKLATVCSYTVVIFKSLKDL